MIGLKHLLFWIVGILGFISCLMTVSKLILLLSTLKSPPTDDKFFQSGPAVDGSKLCCGPALSAFLWNLLLLYIFIAQHSIMASQTWKDVLNFFGLSTVARSLYVIATSAALHLLVWYGEWMPGPSLWQLDIGNSLPATFLFALLHVLLWYDVIVSSCYMDPWELTGLRQVYNHCWVGNDVDPMSEKAPDAQVLFQHMRHSGVISFMLILWLHPVMSAERFLLAIVFTIYSALGFRVGRADCNYLIQQKQENSKDMKHNWVGSR